jgi:hypothetical protein
MIALRLGQVADVTGGELYAAGVARAADLVVDGPVVTDSM